MLTRNAFWLALAAAVVGSVNFAARAADIEKGQVLLTPPPTLAPRINGPRIYEVRPGAPFLFRIPCTGARPMTFAADALPEGLVLHADSGIITGATTKTGLHRVTLIARNASGEARREFRIVVGDQLALTPPMGWNSWYIHYNRVSDAVMRQAADQMITSGMADYGYQYVNIDDCWMNAPAQGKYQGDPKRIGPLRTDMGDIRPNAYFPDMKGMVEYVHARGLKAGIYTSPGPLTCAGFGGSYQHEAQDARQFAAWGFDFLKYDWCSYGRVAGDKTVENLKKPYKLMSDELRKLDRDVVFNLCQYGMGEVWTWGGDVGHAWRTTGDLGLERGAALPGFYKIAFSNARHAPYARPGAWNDPDYILIGWVGDARGFGQGKPTTLTPDEQYSYMSLWSLMAAPLIFSGDMAKLDAFTLNVLCNDEVIDVDQDPLGKQARVVRQSAREFVLLKDMEDGSKVLGIFNLADKPATLGVAASDLGISGVRRVRDLWRQQDLGERDADFEIVVPPHGVSLVRLSPRRP
jgi:alpha-galactosidase